MQEVAIVLPLAASSAGESAFGGEAQREGRAHSDWPCGALLCLSAALSRRFSSSTKGYISSKLDPSHCSFFIELLLSHSHHTDIQSCSLLLP